LLSANVHAFYFDVSDETGERAVMGQGPGARISSHSGELVKIVTIDEFAHKHDLSVGFLKGEVEGQQ
jgi:hypothetical protein